MKKIICLWSCPRNISTALMYSFGNREDTEIYDEALYGYYLHKTGLKHPGYNEIINNMEIDSEKVINQIILNPKKDINFHKLMTHFLIDIDLEFLKKVSNIIFIRNPKEIINSYCKVIPNPTEEDIGVKQQYELYNHLIQTNNYPVVLDSSILLKNPKEILTILCDKLEISYSNKMLKWAKGPKKADGIWAKYWYKNVHNSTGFKDYEIKNIKLSSKNQKLAKDCQKYYNFLFSKSITT
ncbi:sulfotransferase family protein [Flavobacteriales bacterium]|nr:sulfotransferase family protein [Flavobacteriales bacterium]